MAHWPTAISPFRRGDGHGQRRLASGGSVTFNSTSIRLWSVATSLAGSRVPSSRWTSIWAGFWMKLKALETMYPSAETTRPVVGPGADQQSADALQAADRFDLHDRRSHAIDGRFDALPRGAKGLRRQREREQPS